MTNMNELMRQAARLQRRVQQVQDEMKQKEWSAQTAGDKVSATVNGEHKVNSITVDPEFWSGEDRELVLASVAAAINAAHERAEKDIKEAVSAITGNMKIPGLTA